MKVEKIMTADVKACGPGDPLSTAARIMWDADCGIVPVIDVRGHVIGVITDRDICIACWSRDSKPGSLNVGECMTIEVNTCTPADSVAQAQKVMERHQIRRLPVIDSEGKLVGIISLTDITRAALRERAGGVRADIGAKEVVEAMAAICRPRTSERLQTRASS